MTNIKIQKGFTLVEILIATAIFAIVMVMTTSVISQSVGYQAKISSMRQTSNESRKMADLLSRDIRSAKGSFKIAYNRAGGVDQLASFKHGMGIFKCPYNGSGCTNVESLAAATADPYALVIANGQKIKIYWFVTASAQATYYYEYNFSDLDPVTGLIPIKQPDGTILKLRLDQIIAKSSRSASGGDPAYNLIAGSADSALHPLTTKEMKTVIILTHFYSPVATTTPAQQNFVEFEITSEIGVSTDKVSNHAISKITTAVTGRDYSL